LLVGVSGVACVLRLLSALSEAWLVYLPFALREPCSPHLALSSESATKEPEVQIHSVGNRNSWISWVWVTSRRC